MSEKHSKDCNRPKLTPIKKLEKKDIPVLAEEYREHAIISFRDEKGNYKKRKLTREEAINSVEHNKLGAHGDEISPREKKIDFLIKKVMGIKGGYFVSNGSSISDFMSFSGDREKEWKKTIGKINKEYGILACKGCLKEADYLWRVVDYIEFLKLSSLCDSKEF